MVKYKDIRTNLNSNPATGDLLLFSDENAINSQIKNLIFTDYYEVPWSPTQGAGVPQTLFDNFSNDFEYVLTNRITETINKYVKRAELLDVKLVYDNNNGYDVTIVYRPLNELDPVTFKFFINRTR